VTRFPSAIAALVLTSAISLNCAGTGADALAAPKTPADKTAALGESFTLRLGESVNVDESVRVGLINVTSDSRCPKGVQCVWEGDATLQIWIQPKGGEREERKISGAGREPSAGGTNFEVRLVRLDPQPVSGRAIEPAEYVATLQVQRVTP